MTKNEFVTRMEALIGEIDAELKLYVSLYCQEPKVYIHIPLSEWEATRDKLKAIHTT